MVTLQTVSEAYNEYGKAMDKAREAFTGGCREERYNELVNEANAKWDEYKELDEIWSSGGLID
ncbi:hypothetical protein EVB81_202 [Rhizobium phage RHph_I46]|uniref:Uncharacterized protein n=1 Tax=Rhizobium phage RHph_I1_9 TaxID=2509729 RepID=A0A7S5R9K5_9CAUD|nr:hypothetical protein PP936_gp200 [Rhizobium phage RHph_I1_9]QIG69771.1 hypothetical protein EVB81_202 [Rhizobium phage RHph_I46]QIG71052.1 hypothetical protein EVB92_202 [Rhizobium phage RHph_I9]QIG73637.1 hypothetical protein EVC04_200 [Rhizobium phage RHph_I1_9]QIG76391.1 hypothetical protein EVC25_202 [Rhizobium phage RHph_I34]